ncbi:MAG TPA: ABC transporter substrate-binding protein [Candidatus Binatia bacterium]|nr:ABC transporter substrate-binding protein [Candidatus Binatia bacterium]
MKKAFQLTLCALLSALCFPAEAQQAVKVYRIGFLASGFPPDPSLPASPFASFRQRLRELGYVEGQNIVLEIRYAKGDYKRLPGLAADLVKLKADIIVASGLSAVRAAKDVTRTIPIVMVGAMDPVAFELVASLARPGGNVTGLSDSTGRELEGKRLELLKETVPKISRVGVVLDSASRLDPAPIKEAARALGLTLILSSETATPEEFESTFATLIRERVTALYAPETPVNARHRGLIIDLAIKHRLPAMYGSREFVEAGGLIAYGANFADLFHHAATYVDKIMKGIKPAELPVQQPLQFELVVNLKAAKKIGLNIPPGILARADRVIK